jgi:hypothetical protein
MKPSRKFQVTIPGIDTSVLSANITALVGSHPGCNCQEGFLGPHCELRESAELPSLRAKDPYANQVSNPATANEMAQDSKGGFYVVAFWIMFTSVVVGLVYAVIRRYRRRFQKQRNAAITSSLQWSPAYKDCVSNEINIAPGSAYSDVYEEATRDAFATSSRDPMVASVGAAASTTAVAEVSPDNTDGSDDDDFPDDLRSEPRIDIGPPIDEDGHELHNVEIV